MTIICWGFSGGVGVGLGLLAWRFLEAPQGVLYHDHLLARYAEENDAVVVTRDKSFPYRRKIVLASEKYEKMWTELCRGIRALADE